MRKRKSPSEKFDDYEGYLEPQPGDTGDDQQEDFDFLLLEQYIAKNKIEHNVSTDEIRQVFANEPSRRFAKKGRVPGEDLYIALGRTDAGRYLLVVFIWKFDGVILPVSARNMEPKERQKYERK